MSIHASSGDRGEHMQLQERAPTLQLQPRGLTESEVAARRSQGLTNVLPVKTSRTYLQILGENVFTVIVNPRIQWEKSVQVSG
jgi:hypothetical protein